MTREALDRFYSLKVSDIVRLDGYATGHPGMPVLQVLALLVEHDRVWIVDEESRLAGVVTRKDVLDMLLPPPVKSAPGYAPARTLYYDGTVCAARDMMTSRIVSIDEGATLREALEVMRADNIRRLPVVKGGAMTGELSMRSLIEMYLGVLGNARGQRKGTQED